MAEKTVSKIITRGNAQILCVNGREIGGVAYMTYLAENNRYADFARVGYRLFSLPLFFGTNNLNEFPGSRSFSAGIYDGDEPYYEEFDRNIRRILEACPDAMILPRVNVNLSERWEAAHPDELCDTTLNPDPHHRRSCLASDIWAEEVKRLLTLFVAHIEGSPYVRHIIGYQIAGGNTEEWLAYDGNAFAGKRSREKFDTLKEAGILPDTEAAFYRFHADIVADRICELAAHIKALTDRRLIVGSFYGYTLEAPGHTVGHAALRRLLLCEDVDFICSPVSYAFTRVPGIEHAYMVPLHSLKLHGKLYFSENDTRTHLSQPFNDHPYYQAPIWFGPEKPLSLSILKMHFARALIYGHASWWFDMWGGWYEDAEYMAFMKQARQITEEALTLPCRETAQIALFADEEYCSEPAAAAGVKQVCKQIRRELGLMGVPYHIYLASDFDQVKDRYRACISLVPMETEGSRAIEHYAQEHHVPHLRITAENCGITAEDLREFCRRAGVEPMTDRPAVVYANDRFLFVHAAEDGELNLRLSPGETLTELFTGEISDGRLKVKKGDSYLFRRQII
ncbi:MAG: hypothetical protein IJW99_07900 [Clostridia bacterium]|nr:hypothetical protein [Clostridia bacterium]